VNYYSKSQKAEENSIIWPGFVDVLASTLMVIIFVVLLFTVAQVYLGDLVVGKNEQIQNLEKTIEIQDETIVEQDLSLSGKELALIERQEVIKQLDTELEILDEEIRSKQTEISEKENLLIAKDDLINQQAIDITELNEIIARITEELSLSLEEKEELRSKLSSLGEEQQLLKNQLQELGGENQLLVGQLSESQGRIQSLLESLSSSKGENEILETQISSVENQNQTLRDQISSLEQDSKIQVINLNEALAQISRLSEDIKILSNEIQLLNNLLDSKEAEIASNKIELGELGDRLNRVLTSELFKLQKYKSEFFGQLSETLGQREDIQIKGDRFIFQSEILFESGSADIQAEGRAALSLVAKTLIDLSDQIPTDLNWILQIDGHTDMVPIATSRFPSNWELSHARALEVLKFFIQQGIPADKLSANGYGEHQPISLGSSPEDLKLNRRIELKITQR
jgi:chemotaxis protein MotB